MKALVTGGTGLVGSHLVKHLLSKDYSVVALGRDETILDELNNLGAETLTLELTEPYESYSVLNDYSDYIWYHTAAALSGASTDILDAVNVEGTEKLVQKAEEIEINKFVLISSRSVYGVSRDEKLTENHSHIPDSEYGTSKFKQEQIVKNSTLDWIIFRPPYIGGPNDQNFLVELGSRIKESKMPTFTKEGIIGYIDVRDLVKGIEMAISNGIKGKIYNIQGEAISLDDFVEKFAVEIGVEPPYGPRYPYWLAMAVGIGGDVIAKILGRSSERGVSRYRVKSLTGDNSMDTSKIENELGFQPSISVEQSIREFLKTSNL